MGVPVPADLTVEIETTTAIERRHRLVLNLGQLIGLLRDAALPVPDNARIAAESTSYGSYRVLTDEADELVFTWTTKETKP